MVGHSFARNRSLAALCVSNGGTRITTACHDHDIIVANKLNAITNTSGLFDDGDGLALKDELLYGGNPTKADTDSDGWTDNYEVATANTLPYDADTDNNGQPDPSDPQPHIPANAAWFGATTVAPPSHWWTNSPSKPVFDIKAYTYHRYFYDTAGNLSMRIHNNATNRFFYNAQNKLVRIEGPGFTNEFMYDSFNRRIGVALNGSWRYDLHEGMICFASVTNGIMEKFFVRGAGIAEGTGDMIAEVETGCAPHYYVANHRGDTVAVVDGSSLKVDRYAYDAFGNPTTEYGTPNTGFHPRYTFSTKEYLADAQLYLYAYRVYDPIAGRWTQRDPIGYEDSPNLYQFCGNNPVNGFDPDGRDWQTRVLGAAKAVMGLAAVSAGVAFGTLTLPTVVGAAAGAGLAVLGIDVITAGVAEVWTGEPQTTIAESTLQQLGASPEEASLMTYTTLGMGTGYASGMNAASGTENWQVTRTPEPATGKKYKGGTSYETRGVNTVTGVTYERHTIERDGQILHDHQRYEQ